MFITPVRSLIAAVAALALAGCASGGKPAMQPPVALSPLPQDVHSYARPNEARGQDVFLDLTADFAAKRLIGSATLEIAAAAGAREIVLDVKDLDIRSVTSASGEPLPFELGPVDPILGQSLTVQLPKAQAGAQRANASARALKAACKPGEGRDTRHIVVEYATRPEAAALQWLSPAQTAGKQKPFLFSQGQAILTRTWIPTQDSPGIRQTYMARITAPEGLRPVMSAADLDPDGEPAGEGLRAWTFELSKPVPPYLIALAIGDLAFAPIGEQAGVWAESGLVAAAAAEFEDLPAMIAAAEALYGPYRWGRYDVLVLPPSFPFGGMENPRLTFATPTILAGDKSLVSLIAHELAHSWSGNLVTNATWDDFWLNEGFTTYFENRIMEAVFGPERAAMLANLGYQDLAATVEQLGGSAAPDTRLKLELAGRDPDSGMTDIAYEKGAAFLRALERAAGRARWDAYLRSYFDRFAFQPMTSEGFLTDVRANLFPEGEPFSFAAWVDAPGVPGGGEPPPSAALEQAAGEAARFAGGVSAQDLAVQGWTTQEWQRFLEALPRALPDERLAALDAAFQLSKQGNSEILFAWLLLAIDNRYEPAVPAVERFLTTVGRRKFVRPLFAALVAEGEWGRPLAERIYAKARPGYHSVTSGAVDALLQ